MEEEAGRPIFDISSFMTYMLPKADLAQQFSNIHGLGETLGIEDLAPMDQERMSTSEHEQATDGDVVRSDLSKYGPPDALLRLGPVCSPVAMAIIQDSVKNVRFRVTTEIEVLDQLKQQERQAPTGDSTLAIDKGKGAELALDASTGESLSSTDLYHDDNMSFYTPSEGYSPAADGEGGPELEIHDPSTQNTVIQAEMLPRNRAGSSASILPRRRDLLKAIIRMMSDSDRRRVLARRSIAALQHSEFRAITRQARQFLRHPELIETT